MDAFAESSSSIELILVGLTRSRISSPRSIDGCECACLRRLPSEARRNTADSLSLMLSRFFEGRWCVPGMLGAEDNNELEKMLAGR